MADIRIEIDGTRARLFVGDEEITERVSKYVLVHRAGEMPTLQVTFNATDASVTGEALICIPESIKSFFEKHGHKECRPPAATESQSTTASRNLTVKIDADTSEFEAKLDRLSKRLTEMVPEVEQLERASTCDHLSQINENLKHLVAATNLALKFFLPGKPRQPIAES